MYLLTNMKILPLEQILDTCDSVQAAHFEYTLSFTSMEERALWLHYYEHLVRYYCKVNVYKTECIIVIHIHDHLMEI